MYKVIVSLSKILQDITGGLKIVKYRNLNPNNNKSSKAWSAVCFAFDS